ncbi:hypothetical protein CEV34_0797 [Brucella pseudogrignonensis]|uniref:Uncharacterized protein n=1 Tax=Brucella pseudogrignonensis TaxID=419475 RepID=A0A256GQQ1_9HYPH|nr:hypothetical protein CEV34_0797 [Brucella pseudogrignonensis]
MGLRRARGYSRKMKKAGKLPGLFYAVISAGTSAVTTTAITP